MENLHREVSQRSDAMNRALIFLVVLWGVFCPLLGQDFQLNAKGLSSSLTFYEMARVKYLPEIGMLEYFPYKMEDKIFMVDLQSQAVRTLGKKGNGPDEFGVERNLFSDGTYVYLFDSTKRKLLKYALEEEKFQLDDIILIKQPVARAGKRHQMMEVIGKMGENWVVQYLVFPDPTTITKDSYLSLSLSVGLSNPDFSKYEELYYREGKEFPQSANSADSYFCRANGKYFVVIVSALNSDPEKGILNVVVIDVQGKTTKQIPVPISEKFTEFQALNNDTVRKERRELNKFKFVPWGPRFQGLDGRFYLCYYHQYPNDSFDILFTVLDPVTGKVKQFEQKKSTMKPIMANRNQIAYVKYNKKKDNCDLIIMDKANRMN